MKRIILALSIVILLLILLPQTVLAEEIVRFDEHIEIVRDGSISVTEKIIYDFGNLERHGIYREIPYIKTNQDGKKFRLTINLISVKNEKGAPYNFSQNEKGGDLKIKIGDADKTITGIHTYIISYTVSGALTYFSDHDELYWNVTGNKWKVPIREASTEVLLPIIFNPSEIKVDCFTGYFRSEQKNCTLKTDGISANFTSQTSLKSSQGMTIVVGFPKNVVAVVEPEKITSFTETVLGKIFLFLLILISLFWYVGYPLWIVVRWYKFGRDPKVFKPVSTWFDPPKTKDGRELAPAEAGTLVDEKVNLKDIGATVIDLARRGYLAISEEKKNDFSFIKNKEFAGDASLLEFERRILEGLFAPSGTFHAVRLKSGLLYNSVEDVKKLIYQNMVLDNFFPESPQKIRQFYMLIFIASAVTFNPLLFLSTLIFGKAMSKRTLFGAEQLAVAKSLKNFLTSQERQLKFQVDKQLLFEKLLPYAVAFGVEKIWAERFADVNLKPPEWFSSYRSGAFNTILFASALSSSMTSFASAATPTRSSSGFSSGFGGGGFSGGGGGGGGGGSW